MLCNSTPLLYANTALFCALLMAPGCQSKSRAPRPTKEETKTELTKSDAKPPIAIPSGNEEELFAFIVQQDAAPLPEDVEVRSKELIRRMSARVRAAEAILKKNRLSPESRISAIGIKLDALRMLAVLDPHGLGEQFETYVDALIDGDDQYLVRLAKTTRFQLLVNDYVSGKKLEPSHIENQLRELLSDPDAGPSVFVKSKDAVTWLDPATGTDLAETKSHDHMLLTSRLYRRIGDRFCEFSNDDIAAEANGLRILADRIASDVLVQAALSGDESATDKLRSRLREMLASDKPHGEEKDLVGLNATTLEYGQQFAAALCLYKLNADSFPDDDYVQVTYEKAKIRLALPGRQMRLNGILNDGSKFDWSDYRGKHVLVCFWATWNSNWHLEVENIASAVEKYGDRLQVVTVSCDESPALQEYLTSNHLDWPIVVSADPRMAGLDSDNAVRHGVLSVPFSVLVDPAGVITKIHVFGPHLDEALSKELL